MVITFLNKPAFDFMSIALVRDLADIIENKAVDFPSINLIKSLALTTCVSIQIECMMLTTQSTRFTSMDDPTKPFRSTFESLIYTIMRHNKTSE